MPALCFDKMLLVLVIGCLQVFVAESAEWNRLSATFGRFTPLPMDKFKAIQLNWEMIGDSCNKGSKSKFVGYRYVKDQEYATVLIYDESGNIAGIQMATKADAEYINRRRQHDHPFVVEGEHMFITAYFIDPESICNKTVRRLSGTVGDRLVILNEQHGHFSIPTLETGMKDTLWVKGKCYPGMGQHYWYNVTKDMKCDDLFPVFLLYDNGRLSGFGFATDWQMHSENVEHPPPIALGISLVHYLKFFSRESFPKCLLTAQFISTQHIFQRGFNAQSWMS